MSVAISRVMIHREYARLRQGSLASLAHLEVRIALLVGPKALVGRIHLVSRLRRAKRGALLMKQKQEQNEREASKKN